MVELGKGFDPLSDDKEEDVDVRRRRVGSAYKHMATTPGYELFREWMTEQLEGYATKIKNKAIKEPDSISVRFVVSNAIRMSVMNRVMKKVDDVIDDYEKLKRKDGE